MKGKKIKAYSKILEREFHIDEFTNSEEPKGVILWFGRGVDEELYNIRGKNINLFLDKEWIRLRKQLKMDLPFTFIFLTGPYDIRINDFTETEKEKWVEHIKTDIMSRYPNLPFYLIGNSGGAALALNGVHKLSNIVGAGCIGGDDIPADLEIPLKKDGEPKWILNLYYNTKGYGDWDGPQEYYDGDLVYADKMKPVVDILCRKGYADISGHPGVHNTKHSIKNRSVEGLIRRAIVSFY